MTRFTAFFMAAAFTAVFFAGSFAYAGSPILVYPDGDSERRMEEQVGAYLQKEKNWNINYKRTRNDPGDVYLSIAFGLDDPTPDLRMIVDAQHWVTDRETKKVTGKKLYIRCYRSDREDGGMWIGKKAIVLNALNEWALTKSFLANGCIDKDGDLVLEAYIPIYDQSAPVYMKTIEEVIDNTISCWIEFHKKLHSDGLI